MQEKSVRSEGSQLFIHTSVCRWNGFGLVFLGSGLWWGSEVKDICLHKMNYVVILLSSFFPILQVGFKRMKYFNCTSTLSKRSATAKGGGILSLVAKWNSWGIVICFLTLQNIPNSPLLSNIYKIEINKLKMWCCLLCKALNKKG